MRAGDIVFTRNNNLPSRLIRYFDNSSYSHCGIMVSSTKILEVNYNYSVKINPFTHKDYEAVGLKLNDIQRDRLVHYGIELVGSVYDWKKILWFICNRVFGLNVKVWDDKSGYICSELVEVLLSQIGMFPVNEVGKRSPSELYDYLKRVKK